jgi:hypothetical protein
MLTQIACPRCRTPFSADIHQIIDVGRVPELKQMFVSGALNVVQCPACGAVTQVATPLLYHDPAHELFMVYVPMEMGLRQPDQERLIGQLVKRAMDSLPPEQRRGYMLQPQTIISLQTFMEKVLETEGITKEDLERQQKQANLLRELMASDANGMGILIDENDTLVDGQFFALLRTLLDASEAAGEETQALKLINIQAQLYQLSTFGRKLEKQQRAVHALSREARKEGLTPKLLLKHVMANRDDQEAVQAIVGAGLSAFNYEFFVLLTEKIEKRQKSGAGADELVALREQLLAMQQQIEQQSREVLGRVEQLLRRILSAEDMAKVIADNLKDIDDTFMYLLGASIEQAHQRGDKNGLAALQEVQNLILAEMERQAPPEIQLLNQLLRAEDEVALERLITEHRELVSPQMLQLIRSLENDERAGTDPRLNQQLKKVERLIEAKLALQ